MVSQYPKAWWYRWACTLSTMKAMLDVLSTAQTGALIQTLTDQTMNLSWNSGTSLGHRKETFGAKVNIFAIYQRKYTHIFLDSTDSIKCVWWFIKFIDLHDKGQLKQRNVSMKEIPKEKLVATTESCVDIFMFRGKYLTCETQTGKSKM